jgi:hypothetical protein
MPNAARPLSNNQHRNGVAVVRRHVRTPIGPPRATPTPRADETETATRRWVTPTSVFFLISALVVYVGSRLPTERYITPRTGFGYALGIIGGSLMLLLLLYSARKRAPWLGFLGSVTGWFEAHMVLGIVGPILILFHSNFHLGATNSNVAFYCMLIVSGSGLMGRYIYSRIHYGLYGRKTTLIELQSSAERLRSLNHTVSFLPELVSRLETNEAQLLASGPYLPLLGIVKPLVVATNAIAARWRLRRYVRRALREAARRSPTLATHRKRLRRAAMTYIDTRLIATRRVAEFEAYERLFAVWHLLHVPMFFMLLVAAIVHVIAVNVY